MPVSGLVVSLSDEPQLRADALSVIGREPRITMGICEENRLAIVVETVNSDQDRQLWEWLGDLPGVTFVEVAFIGFDQHGESLSEHAGQVPTAMSCEPAVVIKDLQHGR